MEKEGSIKDKVSGMGKKGTKGKTKTNITEKK